MKINFLLYEGFKHLMKVNCRNLLKQNSNNEKNAADSGSYHTLDSRLKIDCTESIDKTESMRYSLEHCSVFYKLFA